MIAIQTSIAKGSVTSIFSYGANQQRYLHVKSGISGGTQTIYSIDKLLEIEIQGTRTTYRHYFDGVAILNKVVDSSTSWVLGFNLQDRLGSVVTLADETGSVLEHRSFDPFGKPRRGDFVDVSPSTIKDAIGLDPHAPLSADPITDRGFTDHEHLDDQQIIHMNGRVYDYNIGRFTSVDPFIQEPTSSQSINPYSYILNNPLAGTDPSGYSAQDDTPKKDTETKPRDARAEQFKRAQKYSGTASARPAGGGKKYFLKIDVSFKDAGGNGGSKSNNDKARPGRGASVRDPVDGSYQQNEVAGSISKVINEKPWTKPTLGEPPPPTTPISQEAYEKLIADYPWAVLPVGDQVKAEVDSIIANPVFHEEATRIWRGSTSNDPVRELGAI